MKRRTAQQRYDEAAAYWIMIQRGAMRVSEARLAKLERKMAELRAQIERERQAVTA